MRHLENNNVNFNKMLGYHSCRDIVPELVEQKLNLVLYGEALQKLWYYTIRIWYYTEALVFYSKKLVLHKDFGS